MFAGATVYLEVTAPATGVLAARLSWDPWFNDSLLVLGVGQAEFKPLPPDWAPIIGRVPVTRGQTYRLTISRGGTGWLYDDPFVLTTAMEIGEADDAPSLSH